MDTLLFETIGAKPTFSRVWDVVKILLVLSHGQASVGRGFSINKELTVENQKERSLGAQRLVVDHVRSVGGIIKVEITKELLLSDAGARQKYHGYVDEEKRKKKQQAVDLKRKALTDELCDLRKKRARIIVPLRNQQMNMLRKQTVQANLLSSPNPTVSAKPQKKRKHLC